jgi:hypothetical protein
MRLYSGKVHALADECVRALVQAKDIEVESSHEVVRDLESVLNGYVAAEREVNDRAKQLLEARSMPVSELGRLRRLTAEQRGIKIGEEMLDYLLDQCIEMLMHSANVEEVYAEDHVLRRSMRPVFRKYLELDEAVEAEVRGKLKHVKEGSRDWDVEYRRMMEDIQRRKGLV